MPLKQKDFGKFKYPSVYIVETDSSRFSQRDFY